MIPWWGSSPYKYQEISADIQPFYREPPRESLGLPMKIDVYHHFAEINVNELKAQLDRIEVLLNGLTAQGIAMSAEFDALQAEVAKNAEVDQSAIVLLQGLSAQILALKDDPVALAAMAANLSASSQALADAVVANTPAA